MSIVRPFLAIALTAGTMLATGGCALVSSQMGEGDSAGARRNFSFFTLFGVAVSALFCAAGIIFRAPLLRAMGTDSSLYAMCEAYAIPIFLLVPFAMVSIILQIFFVAAGRPGLGFGLSIAGGLVNIILDYVLIAVIPLSVAGAAYASAAGYVLQAIIGTAFFFANRSGSLYFVRPRFDAAALLKACGNGASEMVGMLSVSVTMIAMNVILMKLSGADGVAAAAVILSAQTILSAAYAGYVQGAASVVSIHHGASNRPEFGTLYRAALKTIASLSVMTLLCAVFLARPIALLFAKDSPHVVDLAVRGMNIFAAAFLLMGFNLFASGFFTALNDGKTSALLSLFRTLVFLLLPLLILPGLLGVDGVWLSMPTAELLGAGMSLYYFIRMKNRYHYDEEGTMSKLHDVLMRQFENMDKAYEEYARANGLTYLSLSMLEAIYKVGDSCTQKRISEETHYPKQTVNLVINSFLESGCVELQEIPSDRCNKQIILTAKGRQLCERVVAPMLEAENRAVRGLSERQSELLAALFELYGESYCEELKRI